ncbi:hypothetical protein [Paludisphaera borealis]|uniref:Uncharacterized protein n=1 Tax=Paludisphaera borealis TaxID=1387353 RepID=A0A1U7CWU1_9BACT|nr:hypothetical protein [Paludisphaera borealis]APW63420.1 hypothetical protein BSF38_04987 [Paludisphaera borealis]
MSQAPEQALVPPRPNPGPEPWSGDGGLANPLLIVAVAAAGLSAVWLWRRRRRVKQPSRPPTPSLPLDESPEARLLALCEQVRGTLSSRFGPGLRARTTEEIAVDLQILDLLGVERFDRLTELLRTGDRLKFARQGTAGAVVDQLGELVAWASALDTLPHPPRPVNDQNRRSPGERNGRRSPRTDPPRS